MKRTKYQITTGEASLPGVGAGTVHPTFIRISSGVLILLCEVDRRRCVAHVGGRKYKEKQGAGDATWLMEF